MAYRNDKGKFLEEYVAERMRYFCVDPKAYRSHGSGSTNTEKGDIWTSMTVFGRNAGIEVKNQKTICIPEWWRQTQKLESLGREPILAFKLPGESLDGTKVVIYLDTFLELVRAHQLAIPTQRKGANLAELARELRSIADDLSPAK
jgi:hypothetical protein